MRHLNSYPLLSVCGNTSSTFLVNFNYTIQSPRYTLDQILTTESLYSFTNPSEFPPFPAPENHHSTLCFYVFNFFFKIPHISDTMQWLYEQVFSVAFY